MVDVLKYNFLNAQIDLLVNISVSELLESYPNINKVQSIGNDSIKDIKKICLDNKYDLAIAVHSTFKIAMALFLAGVKYRLGTGYRWYSVLYNLRNFQHRKYSLKHELEYNLDLLNELHCSRPANIIPTLNVESETIDIVKQKLLKQGIPQDKKFIIVHAATLGSAKVWSLQNFVKLIDLIKSDKDYDFDILLTGTKEDDVNLNKLLDCLCRSDSVYKINDLSLKELSALIKLSILFISNSTGPIHIAAAVGTFAIGLYSPVSVESAVRWGPFTDRKKIFTPKRNANNKNIMDDIDPIEVFNFVRSYIKKIN
jgi:heptosyltransferase III